MPSLKDLLTPTIAIDASGKTTDPAELTKISDAIADLQDEIAQTYDWVQLETLDDLNNLPLQPLVKFAWIRNARLDPKGLAIWAIFQLRPIYTSNGQLAAYSTEEILSSELATDIVAVERAIATQAADITTLQRQRDDLRGSIDSFEIILGNVDAAWQAGDTSLGDRINVLDTSKAGKATFGGASGSAAGSAGLVPAPAIGHQSRFLRGDGNWIAPPYPSVMAPAQQFTSGQSGLVPQPSYGQQARFLRGDATWADVPMPSPNIPTIQAGVDAIVDLTSETQPSNIHINSNRFRITWDVSSADDGMWHYVMNVGTQDHYVRFSGMSGLFRRNGTASDQIASSDLTVKSGETWLIHLTVGQFGRFVNCAKLGAPTVDLTPYATTANLSAEITNRTSADTALGTRIDAKADKVAVTAIAFNQDISLQCNNTWTARSIGNIGDTSKDFAAPDASNHYKALRDMVIDVSVTAMSGEGGGLTIGCAAQLYRSGNWVNAFATTAITNPSAGVVPFHQTAQIAIKSGDYIRFLTNANDGGGNSYPGTRVFRIGITEAPGLLLMPSNTVLLTPRNITGSITAKGFDGLKVPYQIPLTPGNAIATVTLNGANYTDFDAYTGVVRIDPNGVDVVVGHTVRSIATFNGLQRVDFTTTALALTTSYQNYTVGSVLQEGDLMEVQHEFNGNTGERQSVWVRVQAGTTQRNFPWADPNNNTHYWIFPNPLTATFQVRQVGGGSSPKILSVKVWRDSANGYCVPVGTQIRNLCTITANTGSVLVNGGGSARLFSGTSGRVTVGVPQDQELVSVSAPTGLTATIADAKNGALEIACAENATGAYDLSVTYGVRTGRSIFTTFNAGQWITYGSLQYSIPTGGNRSLQIRSAAGSIVVSWMTWLNWDSTQTMQTATITPSSNQYLQAGWNFTNAGNHNQAIILDATNQRRYRVDYTIGAAYQNNNICVEEIT